MRLIKSTENRGLEIARMGLEEGTADDVVVRAERYLVLLEEHLGALRSLKRGSAGELCCSVKVCQLAHRANKSGNQG